MTIYISGDTHGIWDVNKLKELNATKDDYIIICGDCGVLWDKKSAPKVIELYESFGATVLFVDGNHENFDMLKALPIVEILGGRAHKVSDRIYHLMRGEVFDIGGKKILALGAQSRTIKSGDWSIKRGGKTKKFARLIFIMQCLTYQNVIIKWILC